LNVPKPAPPPGEPAGVLPRQTDVVAFFLNLYRQQVGAGPETPAEFIPLEAASAGSNKVYELRVKHPTDWVRRRMTIGSLGEEGSSKSKCYYVIFDTHLVVKIPPRPIQDFETYVASIRKEGHIVDRLAPMECIIPKVSVILSQIHPLVSPNEALDGRLEETYLDWLRRHPEHQSCLKIKGTFVYFMDLSRYYFLSHIMERFRDLDETLRAEYNAVIEIIRYPNKFRERYGGENEAVGFEIRDLYHQCESDIRQLLRRNGKISAATEHRIQAWFVNYLEKRDIGTTNDELASELVKAAAAIFRRGFETYRESVCTYTRVIHRAAQRLLLEQNRVPIAGIIAHLLDLLAWLDVRKVALRDLKPDNLLVAGETQNYPAFLRSPTDYSLGFIDVETAVSLSPDHDKDILQPLLGGTPYYATPSHLFPNSVLKACFGDVARVLHFQDWQAVMVMVFSAVTGERLFEATASQFGKIRDLMTKARHQPQALTAALQAASRTFWRSALAEFRGKRRVAVGALRRIEVDLSKPVRTLFVRTLKRDIDFIRADIQKRIEAQTCFATPQARERLRVASYDRIRRLIGELDIASRATQRPSASFLAGAAFLRTLAALKAQAESKARMASQLQASAPCRMSAYDLLTFMFGSVFQAMFVSEWNDSQAPPAEAACPANDESGMATMVCPSPEAPDGPKQPSFADMNAAGVGGSRRKSRDSVRG
jgi:hypothetical protein